MPIPPLRKKNKLALYWLHHRPYRRKKNMSSVVGTWRGVSGHKAKGSTRAA
ncbi:MAG: hypothetical protein NTZ31_01650 [Actinobacteria bacterium]|nr:hypothetical protein [Actinomycetota bacterium]